MIMYPDEWRKYMIPGKVRTFSSDTPKSVVDKAKELNEKSNQITGKDFFHFENKA